MTTTPEHQKVEDLKARNQLAGNLAHLLLDSDNWTLSNHRSEPAIDIQVQRVLSDILGIDFEAYQAERIQLLGVGGPNLGVVAKVVAWSAEPALPTIDDLLVLPVVAVVESYIDAPTVDEASLIAGFAQAEDATLVQEPVAFIPGDENAADDTEFYFAEEDVHPAGRVSAAPVLVAFVATDDVPLAPVEPVFAAFLTEPEADAEPAADEPDGEPDGDAAEPTEPTEPEAERIETGNYQLIAE